MVTPFVAHDTMEKDLEEMRVAASEGGGKGRKRKAPSKTPKAAEGQVEAPMADGEGAKVAGVARAKPKRRYTKKSVQVETPVVASPSAAASRTSASSAPEGASWAKGFLSIVPNMAPTFEEQIKPLYEHQKDRYPPWLAIRYGI